MVMEQRRLTSPAGGWRWCIAVVAMAAPAIGSPLMVMPLTNATYAHLPRLLLSVLLVLLSMPRTCAAAATVFAVVGARHYASSSVQAAISSMAIICAWTAACETMASMHLF